MIALNAAVAEQFADFKTKVDARLEAGEELEHALLAEIKSLLLYPSLSTLTATDIPTNGRKKPPAADSTARPIPHSSLTHISSLRRSRCSARQV